MQRCVGICSRHSGTFRDMSRSLSFASVKLSVTDNPEILSIKQEIKGKHKEGQKHMGDNMDRPKINVSRSGEVAYNNTPIGELAGELAALRTAEDIRDDVDARALQMLEDAANASNNI